MKAVFKFIASTIGLVMGGAAIGLLGLLLVAVAPLIAVFIVAYD